uniref:Uncharacterized protein n=1 Tax=Octopus bimaculoides TaxID=37653 RepID=A0A0L8I6E1_OCTBM
MLYKYSNSKVLFYISTHPKTYSFLQAQSFRAVTINAGRSKDTREKSGCMLSTRG